MSQIISLNLQLVSRQLELIVFYFAVPLIGMQLMEYQELIEVQQLKDYIIDYGGPTRHIIIFDKLLVLGHTKWV